MSNQRAGREVNPNPLPRERVSLRKTAVHPEHHRSSARREIPTARQLGVRPSRILLRGLMAHCPACGGRYIFKHWFMMANRCPTCTFRFERVDGHWIGSLAINTVVVFGAMLAVLFSTVMVSYPNPTPWWLLWLVIAIGALGPILFFPPSRMLWTAIDILLRPLLHGEVDPRYIAVDPYRDRPPRT
ncbi:MAG: DUF983 domain-containing protein [Microthrixaceae bacterium]|nr:DUF983 domain-containing protein [Microthrixaceae bacterium]